MAKLGGATIVTALVCAAACAGPTPRSGVTSIEARIDGLTCPTCVPPLTSSLTRAYGKSTIDVDDDKDTATIRFGGNDRFSVADFRAAVERVRMHVVTIRLQACGTVEAANGSRWLTAGENRFLLRSGREVPVDQPLCLDGTLDSAATPPVLEVSAFARQGASGS